MAGLFDLFLVGLRYVATTRETDLPTYRPAVIPLAIHALMLSGGRFGVGKGHNVSQLLYTTTEFDKLGRIVEKYFQAALDTRTFWPFFNGISTF